MVAIIPARGGSKGLPGKNVKVLSGKPLIAYTIEAALEASVIHEVVVSTDSEEIAGIAEGLGARVPFLRPPHLATDESPAIDTYLYTIDRLESEGAKVDELAVLLPTCPLRTSSDIERAYALFVEKKADSVVSYTREAHPIHWHKHVDEELRIHNIWKDEDLRNRQEYKTTYYPNGAIYIFRTDILRSRRYYTDRSFAYIMDRRNSVDIDTEEDFRLAQFYLQHAT